jgi:hypothetical protein
MRTSSRTFSLFQQFLAILISSLLAFSQPQAMAATSDGDLINMYKRYLNEFYEKVKKSPAPMDKRDIIADHFSRVEQSVAQGMASDAGPEAKVQLIKIKRDNAAQREAMDNVDDEQLDDFAQMIKQDGEQADAFLIIAIIFLVCFLIFGPSAAAAHHSGKARRHHHRHISHSYVMHR